jgi:hypothetical protein
VRAFDYIRQLIDRVIDVQAFRAVRTQGLKKEATMPI